MAGQYSLGTAEGVIRISYDGAGVARAKRDQTELGAGSAKASTAMQRHSRIMAEGALVIVAGLGEAAKAASDYQQKMELLVTAGGESQAALASVSKGIEQIAVQTGTGLSDLAEGMYIVEKAGYRGAQGLNVLRVAAEGARAENVDLATMTTGLTSIMQSYAATMKDPVQATNELVAASGLAKTTMQAFVGALPKVLPIASAAGISFAQVSGALATLTQHGTSADEAAQELAASIRALQAPNSVAIKAMQQLGINVNDLELGLGKRGLSGSIDIVVSAIKNHMGPAGTVVVDAFMKSKSAGQDLQTMLGKMPADLKRLAQGFMDGSISAKDYRTGIKDLGGQGYAMGTQFMALQTQAQGFNSLLKAGNPQAATFAAYLKQVMGGAIGMNTALQLSGDSTAYLNDAIATVNKSALESGKDISTWAKTQQNASVKMGQLKASGQVFGVTLGTQVLPVVIALAKGLTSMLNFLAQMPTPMQKSLAAALGLAAALLLMGAAFKKMGEWVKGLKELALFLKLNVLWTKLAAAAQWLWDGAMAAFVALEEAAGIGLIVAAILLIIAAIVLVIKYHKQIAAFFVATWQHIWSFMKAVGSWFAGPFVGFFQGVWKGIQGAFNAVWGFLKGIGEWFAGPFAGFFVAGWNGVMKAFNAVKAFINGFVAFMSRGFEMLWHIVQTIISPFVPLFKAVFGLIQAVVELVFKLIWFAISLWLLLAQKVITTVLGAIQTAWSASWNFIKGIAVAVWDFIYNKIHTVVMLLKGLFDLWLAGLLVVWNATWNAVSAVIKAVWGVIGPYVMGAVHGVQAGLSAAWNAIRSVALAVWHSIESAAKTVWSAIMRAVEVVSGLASKIGGYFQSAYNAVKSKVSALIGFVKTIGSSVLKAVGNLGSLLFNVGKSIIQGLLNGITNMIGKLTSKLKSITNMIPDLKGPAVVDAKLLTPNGSMIMAGLIRGIEGATPALEKALQSVTNSIPFNVNAHGTSSAYMNVMNQSRATQAGKSAQHGPYQLSFDGKILSTFVIDTVTGAPKQVANITTEGTRQVSWAGSGRTAK
jgi:TP901 family phage tail tape measure protein